MESRLNGASYQSTTVNGGHLEGGVKKKLPGKAKNVLLELQSISFCVSREKSRLPVLQCKIHWQYMSGFI